jgi:membrane-associated phospholipid phosphatase
MLTHTTWFLVVFASSLAVVGAYRLAAHADGTDGSLDQAPVRPGWRLRLGVVGGCVVLLLALALAWRVTAFAEVDADVVARLALGRNDSLNSFFLLITCIGDVVPCFLIASLLAVAYYQRTGRFRGFILQVLILVQLLVQTAMTVTFHDITMTDLYFSVPLGGSGTIPSGSVSRLLSLFLVAATLWHSYSPRFERVLLSLAPLVVMTEIVSRLYLGRHLLADIAAGLLLGVILTVAFRWLLNRLAPREVEPGGVVRQ